MRTYKQCTRNVSNTIFWFFYPRVFDGWSPRISSLMYVSIFWDLLKGESGGYAFHEGSNVDIVKWTMQNLTNVDDILSCICIWIAYYFFKVLAVNHHELCPPFYGQRDIFVRLGQRLLMMLCLLLLLLLLDNNYNWQIRIWFEGTFAEEYVSTLVKSQDINTNYDCL